MCHHCTDEPGNRSETAIGRRGVLTAGGALLGASLAGCLGGRSRNGTPPTLVSLGGGKQCDACGMLTSSPP